MNEKRQRRGPWLHRVLIYLLSLLLTVLLIWLLNFLMRDLDRFPHPDYAAIEARLIPQNLTTRVSEIETRKQEVQREISAQSETQNLLQRGMENSRQTMNQLLEMHKLQLQKDVVPSEAEQKAMADSEAAFLLNQARYEKANQEIARLSEEARKLDTELTTLNNQIGQIRNTKVLPEVDALSRRRALIVATIKLLLLLPLLAAAAWQLWRRRASPWAPLCLAVFLAFFLKTGAVVHEYFPSQIFKYIALAAAIVVVAGFLVQLIRTMLAPKPAWLLKQYKEAYERGKCPVCAYPIRRGAMRFWMSSLEKIRGSITLPAPSAAAQKEDPYSCPACGQELYGPCEKCSAIRHTLLPFCESCGNAHDVI